MARWSIKGFSTPTGNYFSERLTPERLSDPKRRVIDSDPIHTKGGRKHNANTVAAAKFDAMHHEPDRVLISVQDTSTGRTQYLWVYLADYGTKWSEVDWEEIIADVEQQYKINVPRKQAPPPKPPTEEPKQAPISKPKRKRSLWDRITDDIREIFLGGTKEPTAPTQPQPKRKRTVVERIPEGIRKLFRLKR